MKVFRTVFFQFSRTSAASDVRVFIRYGGTSAAARKRDFYAKLAAAKTKVGAAYKYIQISPPSVDLGDEEMVTGKVGEVIKLEDLATE